MFLSKKGLLKILLVGICYFILGSITIIASVVFDLLEIENKLFYLGLLCYLLIPLFVRWGRYAEGKGKLINFGNKLVRNELKPAEFIEHYEKIKSTPDLVINKPSVEVLNLVLCAYELLDDKEKVFETIEEMLVVTSEKKKNLVKLIKASELYDCGRIEEAESVFNEVRNSKMDFACQALSEIVLKCDRAKALGDYKTAEFENLKRLEQGFPKLDNAGKLVINFSLAEICEKTGNPQKAIQYYSYCAENGGETAIKVSAKKALEILKQTK